MDSPFKVLQERTNRLNQQYTTENIENIENLISNTVQSNSGFSNNKPDINNDSSLNITTIVRELETQMDMNIKLQTETDLKIGNLEEDMAILLDMNKKQAEKIAELQACLVQAEAQCEELEDIRGEKAVMQATVNECMEKLAEQRVYGEQTEEELRQKLLEYEEKLASSVCTNEERSALFDELVDKYNELKEELDRELELRNDYDQKFGQVREVYETKICELENEIVELNLQFLGEQKNSAALVQKEIDLSKQIICAKNDEIDELNSEQASLRQKVEQYRTEIVQLKAKIEESESARLEFETTTSNRHLEYFKQMEAKIVKLTEQLQVCTDQSVKKEEDLKSECSRKVSEMSECILKLEEEVKGCRTMLETFKTQAEEIRVNMASSLEVKEEIICGLSAERDELSGEVDRIKMSCKVLESELFGVEADYRRVCEEVEQLRELNERIGKESDEVTRLREVNQTIEREFEDRLRIVTQKSEEKIKFLDNELCRQMADTSKYATELSTLKQLIPALEAQFSAEINQMNKMNQQTVIRLTDEINCLKSVAEASDYVDLTEKLKEQVQISKDLDQSLIKRLREETRVENAFALLRKRLGNDESSEKIFGILENEMVEAICELERVDGDLIEYLNNSLSRTGLRKKIEAWRINEGQLKREIKHLEYCFQAEELKSDDLRSQLDREKSTCFEYVQKLADVKKQSGLLVAEVSELKEMLKRVETECDVIEIEKKMMRDESCKMLGEIRELKVGDRALKEENLRLVDEVHELKISEQILKEENSRLMLELERCCPYTEVMEIRFREKQIRDENVRLAKEIDEVKNANLEMKEMNKSLSSKRLDMQTVIQKLGSQNAELRQTVLDRNLLRINNKSLEEKNGELESMVKSLGESNYELKSFITKMSLQRSISESHREKFKRLYVRYLKSEACRRALVYQKKFLMVVLDGYEKSEECRYVGRYEFQNQVNRPRFRAVYANRCVAFGPVNRFRSAVLGVIAVNRIKKIMGDKVTRF